MREGCFYFYEQSGTSWSLNAACPVQEWGGPIDGVAEAKAVAFM